MNELIKRLRKDAQKLQQRCDDAIAAIEAGDTSRKMQKQRFICGGYAYGLQSAIRRIRRELRKQNRAVPTDREFNAQRFRIPAETTKPLSIEPLPAAPPELQRIIDHNHRLNTQEKNG